MIKTVDDMGSICAIFVKLLTAPFYCRLGQVA